MFTQMGAEAFADRTRAELAAAGERARQRSPETIQALTPQEAQVARLVAQGGTNREVAAELFISPGHRRIPPAEGVPEASGHLANPAGAENAEYQLTKDSLRTDTEAGTQSVRRHPAIPGPEDAGDGARLAQGRAPRRYGLVMRITTARSEEKNIDPERGTDFSGRQTSAAQLGGDAAARASAQLRASIASRTASSAWSTTHKA